MEKILDPFLGPCRGGVEQNRDLVVGSGWKWDGSGMILDIFSMIFADFRFPRIAAMNAVVHWVFVGWLKPRISDQPSRMNCPSDVYAVFTQS